MPKVRIGTITAKRPGQTVLLSRPDLSDEELANECDVWVDRLCKSEGRAWVLSIPVQANKDPDMLFSELIRRFIERGNPGSAVTMEET